MDSFGIKYIFIYMLFLLLGTQIVLSDKQCDCESLSFLTELVQQEIFQRKLDYMKLRSELRRLSEGHNVVKQTLAGITPTNEVSGLEKDKRVPAVEQRFGELEKQLKAKLQSGFDELEERTNEMFTTNAKLQSSFDKLEKRTSETFRTYAKVQSDFDELGRTNNETLRINAESNTFIKQTITIALKKEKAERVNFISKIQSLMEDHKGAFVEFKANAQDFIDNKIEAHVEMSQKFERNISENIKHIESTISSSLEEHVSKTAQDIASQKIDSELFEKKMSNEFKKFKAKVRDDIETAGNRTALSVTNLTNKIEAHVEMSQKFERNISENFKHIESTISSSLEEHVSKTAQDIESQKIDSELFEKKMSNEFKKFKAKVSDDIETAGNRTSLSVTNLLNTLKNSTETINECIADIGTIKDVINDIVSDRERDKNAIEALKNQVHLERDCKEILRTSPDAKSGQYIIFLKESNKELSVFCDMETDGGGWTVFQKRINGATDFYRNYTEYENGFGETSGEFWLGLKNIQELTKQGVTELRLDVTLFNGTEGNEIFQDFNLLDPEYTLQLGSYASNSDYTRKRGMLYNKGAGFSTYDHDVDKDPDNCPVDRKGAWWYNACTAVNLNGDYSASYFRAVYHLGLSRYKPLKSTSMMLRRTT